MITRLVLRLPWYLSAPTLAIMAIVAAAGLHTVAGTYFERSFLNEADPLAGLAAPVSPTSATPPSAAQVAEGVLPLPPAASSNAVMQAAVPESPPPVARPVSGLLGQGRFRDGDPGHNGAGAARLLRTAEGAVVLRFEDFSVTNGPDLYVILSPDAEPGRGSAADAAALNLGRLKATTGNINYEVPADADPARYRSVIIYCRAFKVVFATAVLEAL